MLYAATLLYHCVVVVAAVVYLWGAGLCNQDDIYIVVIIMRSLLRCAVFGMIVVVVV